MEGGQAKGQVPQEWKVFFFKKQEMQQLTQEKKQDNTMLSHLMFSSHLKIVCKGMKTELMAK